MSEIETTPRRDQSTESKLCYYFRFGLIVTGKGERKHLPKLFHPLLVTQICNFKTIGFFQQRSPRATRHKLKMAGQGKTIPDKDQEIGLTARRYLADDPCGYVILIDDLESVRREQAQQVFERYRQALDVMLHTEERKRRVSVHFLVNMLEAYYFADAKAVNSVLNMTPPLQDYDGDVETIRHPKNDLKHHYQGFDEVEDGGKILTQIDIEHVLSQPDTCASLRTLFAWCLKVLEQHPNYKTLSLNELANKYRLHDGNLCAITGKQLANL